MSLQNQSQPAKPQIQAGNQGVAAELSSEALHNLGGYFDVLIQMDLAQKISNEIRSKKDEDNIQKYTGSFEETN